MVKLKSGHQRSGHVTTMSPEDIPLNMINNETMDDTRSRSTVKSLTSTMTPRRRSYDYFLGILLLLLVVLLWTFSNFVTQVSILLDY